MSEHRTLQVPDGLAGERVDAAMARMFGLSRTRAAELIAAGEVQVDGSSVGKSDRVLPGAVVDVHIPARTDPLVVRPQVVEGIRIIHDDDSIVVIDKPVGVAVHPSPGWSGPTVVGHLAGAGFRIATSGASERQGIVQRLDVGTSGVMVICKSEHAYSLLKNAFRHRTVSKTYHALVQGHPDPLEGTMDAPIGRHPKADYKFAVMADGRASVTHYETLEAHRFASLLEVHLETGRTHQIRVHMAALKHPCVGDLTYGADPTLAKRVGLERQWLHAVRLGLRAPGHGEYVEYESTYPDDLAARPRRRPRWRLTAVGDGWCCAPRPRGPCRPSPRSTSGRAARPRCRASGLHDDAVRGGAWLAGRLAADEVWLAGLDGAPVGYARLTETWLDDL